MSSFYGNGGGGSSSGGPGSDNYNDLLNIPVSNIGSFTASTSPVLSTLSEKHYNLTGYYRIDPDGEVQYTNTSIDLLIYKDQQTGNKVIQFYTTENAVTYLNIYIYSDSDLVQKKKIELGGAAGAANWEDF